MSEETECILCGQPLGWTPLDSEEHFCQDCREALDDAMGYCPPERDDE